MAYVRDWISRLESTDALFFSFRRNNAKKILVQELASQAHVHIREIRLLPREEQWALWQKLIPYLSTFAQYLDKPLEFATGLHDQGDLFSNAVSYNSTAFFEYGLGSRTLLFAQGLRGSALLSFTHGIRKRLSPFLVGMNHAILTAFAQGIAPVIRQFVLELGDDAGTLGKSFPTYSHGDVRGQWHTYMARSFLDGLGKHADEFYRTLEKIGQRAAFDRNVHEKENLASSKSGYNDDDPYAHKW